MGKELKELEVPVVGESEAEEGRAGARRSQGEDVQPEGAGPVSGEGAGGPEGAAEGSTGETALTPELEALVEARVQGVREEYEGAGGHLARLKSAKDKEIAAVQARLAQRDEQVLAEAMQLAETDPQRAVQMMAQQQQQLMQRGQRERAVAELSQWAERVANDLGVDLDTDEEAAKALGALLERGPDYAHEFQQVVAKQVAARADKAEKKFAKLEESLPGLIDRTLEAKLAEAGVGKVDPASPRRPAGANPIKNEMDPGRLITDGYQEIREGTG